MVFGGTSMSSCAGLGSLDFVPETGRCCEFMVLPWVAFWVGFHLDLTCPAFEMVVRGGGF